ncbi:Uncharacterised protein [uncultured archaeon]|nr:Uncharacterised protein [uncultured archaeon]
MDLGKSGKIKITSLIQLLVIALFIIAMFMGPPKLLAWMSGFRNNSEPAATQNFTCTNGMKVTDIVECAGETGIPQNDSTGSSTTVLNGGLNGEAASIKQLGGAQDGAFFRFYLQLQDATGNVIPADGDINFFIKDNTQNTLYTDKFTVQTKDFVDYQFSLTGQKMGKAIEWRVNTAKISKSKTPTAKITVYFTTKDRTLLANGTVIGIPAYTNDELERLLEKEYLNASKESDAQKTVNTVQVNLIRHGFYSKVVRDEEKTYYRIDLTAKTTDAKQNQIYTYNATLTIGDKQYNKDYASTIDVLEVYPDVSNGGYLLMTGVPKNASGPATLTIGKAGETQNATITFNINV